MLRRFGLVFAALACFSLAGGHWAVLQTVAWTGMLRVYTQQTGSLATAIEQTFDGEHPCELCLRINDARQQEVKGGPSTKSSPLQHQLAKAEKETKALLPEVTLLGQRSTATGGQLSVAPNSLADSRQDQPLTPPPRHALA